MKPRLAIFLLLVLIAAGLTWQFWPRGNVASNPPGLKLARSAFGLTAPATVSTSVQAPKNPPVTASAVPPAPELGPPPKTMPDLTLREIYPSTDLGDVYFTNGLPVPMHANDGTPCTITITRRPDGKVDMELGLNMIGADGKATPITIGGYCHPGEKTFFWAPPPFAFFLDFTPHLVD